jgi:hypothetical protein
LAATGFFATGLAATGFAAGLALTAALAFAFVTRSKSSRMRSPSERRAFAPRGGVVPMKHSGLKNSGFDLAYGISVSTSSGNGNGNERNAYI